MDLLRGLTLLLLCQSAGEGVSRLLSLPLPGPVLGMGLLMAALQAWPPLRAVVAAAAEGMLAHLSLLFVPVGVGVVAHLDLVARFGPQMVFALVGSTLVGLAVTALLLRALLPHPPPPPSRGPSAAPAATLPDRTAP